MFYTHYEMPSSHFIPQSVYYTQSVVHCKPTILDRVNQHKTLPVLSVRETTCFYFQNEVNHFTCEQDLNRLGFEETAIEQ